MKAKLFIISLVLVFSLSSYSEDSQKQKINFDRTQKVGDSLKCDIFAQSKASATRIYTGDKKKIQEDYLTSIKLKGTLNVKSVSETGNADKVEFEVDSIEGIVSNEPYNPEWKGKTIIADLNFRPVCKFSIKGEDSTFSKKERMLLSLIFRPVQKENMAAFIGTDKKVGVGDSWDAPKGPLLNLIKKYESMGLKLSPEKISGKVTIKDRKNYKGIDCWEITENLSIENVPNFSFAFNVKIMLPVDDNTSTIKLIRKGIEKIEKFPKANHPMTEGIKKVTLILSDEMTAEMIPVSAD